MSSKLSIPLFQGDSLHETCAKAASVGGDGMNKERYQRMWLSKMTRTGLLFPEESKPVIGSCEGLKVGGLPGLRVMRRGSGSSIASTSSVSDGKSSVGSGLSAVGKYVNRPVAAAVGNEKAGDDKENDTGIGGKELAKKIVMVLTHPYLEKWHKECIAEAVEEYGIGVIWVPLYQEERPVLDRNTMMSFGSFGGAFDGVKRERNISETKGEILLSIDADGNVDAIIEEIVDGVTNRSFY